ncbi:MAG: hypothetical protein SV760_08665, partial [Halobacteria archaeon]|nr:hypothetical protein [Halobacteria archaeon]
MSKPGSSEGSSESGFSREERALLDRLHSAESLSELKGIMGAESEHEAYFEAKKEWYRLREKELLSLPPSAGLPGDTVV